VNGAHWWESSTTSTKEVMDTSTLQSFPAVPKKKTREEQKKELRQKLKKLEDEERREKERMNPKTKERTMEADNIRSVAPIDGATIPAKYFHQYAQ
jgi:ABC-type phosphate/phosphonate transport system substrate-binding protein